MPLERCERPYCGGWMKQIVDSDGKIEKICAKCAFPPDRRYEKKVEQERARYTEFDVIFRAMWREKACKYRNAKKLFKEVRV